jgi:low temperature requirement protein LtrA
VAKLKMHQWARNPLSRSPLFANGSAPQQHASTLELFFDLVFVFTITQVSSVVVGSPNGTGVAQAAILLGVIYWMYDGYIWMTNAAGPDSWQRTVLLLAGMAGFFVCALAVPRAFREDGRVFGISYLVVTLVHLLGFLLEPRRSSNGIIYGILPGNLISAGLILAASWAGPSMTWALWGSALVLQVATPLLTRRLRGFAFDATHFAERHGTVILIVLGESLISVGMSARDTRVDRFLVLSSLVGLAAITAMWWAYFVGEEGRAATAFASAPPHRQVVQAIVGYELANVVMIFGVTALAAGIKLRVNQLMAPGPILDAWLIAMGASLFLLGAAEFRLALGFGSPWPRAVGAVFCLLAVPATTLLSPTAGLTAVTLVIVATLALESAVESARPIGVKA